MMPHRLFVRMVLASALLLAGSLSAQADEKALRLYEAGRFEEAAKRLADKAQQHPGDAVTHYNYGAAAYKAEQFEVGSGALMRARETAAPSLQQRLSYNLGNTRYRMARAQEAKSPDAARKFYEQALDDFETAIRLDPNDRDAQYNYELVKRRLEQLSSQAAQSQPSQQPSEQDQSSEEPSGQDQSWQEQQEGSQTQPSEALEGEQASGQQQPNEQQVPKEHAQTGEEEKEQAQSSSEPAAAGQEASSAQDGMTQQEALWILDTLRSEEVRAPTQLQDQPAKDQPVDQDW